MSNRSRRNKRVMTVKSKTPGVSKATKKYVDKKVNAAKWSKQIVTCVDLDAETLGGGRVLLTSNLVENLCANSAAIFANGQRKFNTDGTTSWSSRVKLDYVKWQLRYELGSNETTSAIDQIVRELIYRADNQFEELYTGGPSALPGVVDDIDGNIKYDELYGGVKGLYSDRIFILKSQAADSDTTVPGSYVSKGFRRLKYVDTFNAEMSSTSYPTISNVSSEKGQLCMNITCNDPEGTNGDLYGYVEYGWRYLEN